MKYFCQSCGKHGRVTPLQNVNGKSLCGMCIPQPPPYPPLTKRDILDFILGCRNLDPYHPLAFADVIGAVGVVEEPIARIQSIDSSQL